MNEQEIIETQKRIIDTLTEHATEAIIVTDPQRQVTHFNKSAQEITGYSPVDTLGKQIDEFLRIYDSDGEIVMEKCCPTGDIDLHGAIFDGKQLKLITQQGEERVVNVRSIKVKGGSMVNLGCIILIDNTFQQSELERMKLDFVSMAEHVLRTPITIVRGYLSRLLETKTIEKLDENEIGYLNSSFTATDDLLALVEDLLSITEVQRDNLKMKTTMLDLEGVVEKLVTEFKMMATRKGLKLTYIPPIYKIPMVKADILKIKLVLQNLIENAIKYTDDGTITVDINKNDGAVVVSISDTGKGIPEKNISYLFSKFYRVKTALQMQSGMGLGLYMSKKIIDSHGGKIWVESVEGQGSKFSFSLPIEEA